MTLLDLPTRRKPARATRPVRAAKPTGGRLAVPPSGGPPASAYRRLPRYRLTVNQYHRMIRGGILEEGIPVELLDGWMSWKDRSAAGEDPMTVGREHALVIEKAKDLNPRFRKLGTSIRAQQSVTFTPHHEPEPDLSVVRGGPDDYARHHPAPDDILCLLEVSDSSLASDRTKKMGIYANAGVATYGIVNLPDRVFEVYTQPVVGKGRYGTAVTLAPKDKLALPTATGKGLVVTVKSLLPVVPPPMSPAKA